MGFSVDNVRKVILFDLDGTLLPMDQDLFEKKYFQGLSTVMPQFQPQDLVKIVWAGTKMMVLNDGSKPNREAFGEKFTELTGMDYYACESVFEKYYETEFQKCVEVCGVTEVSKEIVHILQKKGYTVAIATNPLFPKIATYSRLRWMGLSADEFPLVTTFEDSHYCKPNPEYYLEVCRRLNVAPEDCMMIGNDVAEDGVAATVGMNVMLVTDCLLNRRDLSTDEFALGTMQELFAWAKELPAVQE